MNASTACYSDKGKTERAEMVTLRRVLFHVVVLALATSSLVACAEKQPQSASSRSLDSGAKPASAPAAITRAVGQ